jgi:hypothetical protein
MAGGKVRRARMASGFTAGDQGKLLLKLADTVAQARGILVALGFDRGAQVLAHILKILVRGNAERGAGGLFAAMRASRLDFPQERAELLAKGGVTGGAPEAMPLVEFAKRETAPGTRDRLPGRFRIGLGNGFGHGGERFRHGQERVHAHPVLGGTFLTKMHLRDLVVSDLGEMNRGGLPARVAWNFFAHGEKMVAPALPQTRALAKENMMQKKHTGLARPRHAPKLRARNA